MGIKFKWKNQNILYCILYYYIVFYIIIFYFIIFYIIFYLLYYYYIKLYGANFENVMKAIIFGKRFVQFGKGIGVKIGAEG